MKDDNITIYGYSAEELVQLAKTCCACDLSPKEVKDFNKATEKVFNTVLNQTLWKMEDVINQVATDAAIKGDLFDLPESKESKK